MLEGETTARIGEIAAGPNDCRRVVLDRAQLIQSEDTAWLHGFESGIVGTGPTASEALLDFFRNFKEQISAPELFGYPYAAQSEDARTEYRNVMRSRMDLAEDPPPDPMDWAQNVEFYDGHCGAEHNVHRIPLIDVDSLPF